MSTKPEQLLPILQECFSPREEGWMWHATYVPGTEQGVVNEIEGRYDDPVETARALAHIIIELEGTRSYLALCRAEGRPRESDRDLWRELRRLAGPESLDDLVIFNAETSWSMRAEDAAAQGAAAV